MAKTTNLALAALLVTSLVGIATPVSAHECRAYEGCDASACKEGEHHEHTDYNHFFEDEYCKSRAPPEEEDGWKKPPCRVLGIEAPDVVCDGPAELNTPF